MITTGWHTTRAATAIIAQNVKSEHVPSGRMPEQCYTLICCGLALAMTMPRFTMDGFLASLAYELSDLPFAIISELPPWHQGGQSPFASQPPSTYKSSPVM